MQARAGALQLAEGGSGEIRSWTRRALIAACFGLPCASRAVLAQADPLPPADAVARVIAAAHEQVGVTVHYDPAYTRIAYPLGDVPPERGVCTDVVVRAFRAAGVDLQQLVHEDMRRAFSEYPPIWGLKGPDRNIDHRRVPNLERFFERSGRVLRRGSVADDLRPGDLVTCTLPRNLPHIMLVSDRRAAPTRWCVVHNIGAGTQIEDRLGDFPVRTHIRWW